MPNREFQEGGWTFLTNHAHIVIYLARHPDAVLREVANAVGITERAVHNIVSDLEKSGVLTRARDGRRNHYVIHTDQTLRHPVEAHCTVGELVAMVDRPATGTAKAAAPRARKRRAGTS